ncbi:MAG: hypothetical protein M3Z85_16155, partial [Acidobacteriota bacterium]|nr:hypothetical protein [Acidobacteriota bacterium]
GGTGSGGTGSGSSSGSGGSGGSGGGGGSFTGTAFVGTADTGTGSGSTGSGSGVTGSTGGGTTTVSITAAVPFTLLGRAYFDGAGGIGQDVAAGATALAQTQFASGSYTVNDDCTGTMNLTGPLGRARSLSFILTQSSTATLQGCTNGIPSVPEIDFALTSANETGYGTGKRQ